MIGHIGGSIGMEPGIMQQVASSYSKDVNDLTDSDRKEVYEQYLATAFILGADRDRFGKLVDKLQNDFLQGYVGYPKTVSSAYHLLANWRERSGSFIAPRNEGVSFTTSTPGESKENLNEFVTIK